MKLTLASWFAVAAAVVLPLALVEPADMAWSIALAAGAVVAWLLERTPPFVPTLLLLATAPLAVEGVPLSRALGWAADPLIALFFGSFALAAAAATTGLDRAMAGLMVRTARGSPRGLVLTLALGGFATSMWLSNAAAAAVALSAVVPVLRDRPKLAPVLLVTIAMSTNFGGLVTPIGSGPNALAMAAVAERATLTFAGWMALALPLAAGLLILATASLLVLHRRALADSPPLAAAPTMEPLDARQRGLVVVFGAAVLGWLTEPVHGVGAPAVSLAVAGLLFATGLLRARDLGRIDVSTLLLVAGGLVVGRLLEHGGALRAVADALPLSELPPLLRNILVVGIAAALSAIMSNTATATLLIPLAAAVDPSPALPVLIAMGCGLGVPFAISTPSNALAAGAGARSRDLLHVGGAVMIFGTLAVALSGERVLSWAGLGR